MKRKQIDMAYDFFYRKSVAIFFFFIFHFSLVKYFLPNTQTWFLCSNLRFKFLLFVYVSMMHNFYLISFAFFSAAAVVFSFDFSSSAQILCIFFVATEFS